MTCPACGGEPLAWIRSGCFVECQACRATFSVPDDVLVKAVINSVFESQRREFLRFMRQENQDA